MHLEVVSIGSTLYPSLFWDPFSCSTLSWVSFRESLQRKEKGLKIDKPFSSYDDNSNLNGNLMVTLTGFAKLVRVSSLSLSLLHSFDPSQTSLSLSLVLCFSLQSHLYPFISLTLLCFHSIFVAYPIGIVLCNRGSNTEWRSNDGRGTNAYIGSSKKSRC